MLGNFFQLILQRVENILAVFQTLLQGRKLLVEFLGEAVAEFGEVLLGAGGVGQGARLVHGQEGFQVGFINVQAVEVQGAVRRQVADGGFPGFTCWK